jgi:hypothetical protein
LKLIAPDLLRFEFYSTMVQHCQTITKAQNALKSFEEIRNSNIIELFESNRRSLEASLPLAFSETKGKQGHISPFDACFHTLAIEKDCTFLTADHKHYNKTYDTVGHIIRFKDLQIKQDNSTSG